MELMPERTPTAAKTGTIISLTTAGILTNFTYPIFYDIATETDLEELMWFMSTFFD